jgi:hypothetical protein
MGTTTRGSPSRTQVKSPTSLAVLSYSKRSPSRNNPKTILATWRLGGPLSNLATRYARYDGRGGLFLDTHAYAGTPDATSASPARACVRVSGDTSRQSATPVAATT